MNKQFFILFRALFLTSYAYSMECKELPKDLVDYVLSLPLYNPQDFFENIRQARQYCFAMTKVNNYWKEKIEDKENICIFIEKLSQKLNWSEGCAGVAKCLNAICIKNYTAKSKQLFLPNITPEKIEALVKKGAHVNYTFSHHNNGIYDYPLHCWIVKENYENIKKLLELGADVNQNCYTNMACAVENQKIFELLISYQPNTTPLEYAIEFYPDNKEIINLCIKREKEISQDFQSRLNKALLSAIFTRREINFDNVIFLLDEGAQPEHVLTKVIAWILRSIADPSETRSAPSLDVLKLLCSYPITNQSLLNNAREVIYNIRYISEQILNVIDPDGREDLPDLVPAIPCLDEV